MSWRAGLRSGRREWEASLADHRRALELSPGSAELNQRLGTTLMRRGRLEEALPLLERSLQLDPLSIATNTSLGRLHMMVGDYLLAEVYLRRATELNPRHTIPAAQLAIAYRLQGRDDDAREAFLQVLDPGMQGIWRAGARLLGQDRALRLLLRLRGWQTGRPCAGYPAFAASVYALTADSDEMFACLRLEIEERHAWHIAVNPVFDPYRDDERMDELLELAGLDRVEIADRLEAGKRLRRTGRRSAAPAGS